MYNKTELVKESYYQHYQKYKKLYLQTNETGFDDYDKEEIESMEELNDDIVDDNSDVVTSEVLSKSKIVDIGLLGVVRGILHDYSEYDPQDFTTIHSKNHKILKIDTLDDFDKFTSIYGKVKKQDITIDWKSVAESYRGFYLSQGIPNRYDMVPYNNKTYNSWIGRDYKVKNRVVIFKKNKNDVLKGEIIKYPFKAKIVDSYGIDEQEFTTFNESGVGKILLMDDVKTFDNFTRKYGSLKNSKIMIDWMRVRKRFRGIYLDSDLESFRKYILVYNNKQHNSWWHDYGLRDNVVYMFL